ncbi:MAG: MATE family efflux transporter [Phycisphaerae bacterium]|nr:MATE family efflux transporter [Phycisphaerae bacterium]
MTEPLEPSEPVAAPSDFPLPQGGTAAPVDLADGALPLDAKTSDLAILLRISGPIMVATISRAVMQFVDFVMVSQLELATQAQAAVGAAGVTLFVLMGFWIGVMSCMNTFASQSLGRNEPHECGAYAWQSIYISVVAGLLALPLLPLARPLFTYFNHGERVVPYEIDYMQIGLFSVGAFTMQVALSNFFNGVHRPRVTMLSAVGANVFNFVANFLLIFGNETLGIPRMEVAGAALGTLLAAAFRCVWLLLALLWPYYAREFGTRRMWRWDWTKARNFLRVGLPAGLQFAFDVMAWSVFMMWLVGRFGKAHLAASNIAWQWCHLSFMPALGIGIGLTAVVGKAIGQGRRDKARHRTTVALGCCGAYMATCGLAFILFRKHFVGWLTDDPEVFRIGCQIMICGGIFQTFDAMCLVYNSALRGAGDTVWTAVALVTTCWVILIGGGYALAEKMPHLGALGPWIAATTYVIVLGLILAVRWRRGRWEQIDIFGDREDEGRLEVKYE